MPRQPELTLSLDGGENVWIDPVSIAVSQCAIWENCDPFRSNSAAVSRRGRTVFIAADGTPSGTRVQGLYEFKTSAGSTFYVVQSGTKYKNATGAAWTDITGTFTPTATQTSFAALGDNLYASNAGSGIGKWTGSGNFAVLTNANRPTDSKLLVLWKNKLWAVEGGSHLKWSKTNDGDDWSAADDAAPTGGQAIEPNDGGDIDALVPFRGGILLCKPHKVYEWTGDDFASFGFEEIRNEGIIDPRAWAVWRGLPIVGTPSGIWLMGSKLERDTNLATPILPTWVDTIATSSKVVFGQVKDVLYVAYDSDADGVVDRGYALYIPLGKWSRWTGQPVAQYLASQNGTLYAETDDARVAVLQLENGNVDEGTNITMTVRTKAFMLSRMPFLRASFDEGRVLIKKNTAVRTMTVNVIKNDLTSVAVLTGTDVQNAGGKRYDYVEFGDKLSDDVVTMAVECVSAGSDEFRIQGIQLVGDAGEGR